MTENLFEKGLKNRYFREIKSIISVLDIKLYLSEKYFI